MLRQIAIVCLMLVCFACAAASPKNPAHFGCMQSEDYAKAATAHEQGLAALGRKDFKNASSVFDQGIGILGEAYLFDDLVDDTGMKLTLAKFEEGRGRLEIAANIKNGVLSSRLDAYRSKTNCGEK